MFIRYVYDQAYFFKPICYELRLPLAALKDQFIEPMHTPRSIEIYQQLYGECAMQVPIPTFVDFLLIELIRPFTFVCYVGVIIWWIEGFLSTSICLIVSTSFFWIINYLLVKQGMIKIQ